MPKNKTRRNKSNGGGCGCNATKPLIGGRHKTNKHKTRKMSKGASSWVESVMGVFKELKAKNPSTKFRDALKEASRRKKSGTL